jgi:hypothetical protein
MVGTRSRHSCKAASAYFDNSICHTVTHQTPQNLLSVSHPYSSLLGYRYRYITHPPTRITGLYRTSTSRLLYLFLAYVPLTRLEEREPHKLFQYLFLEARVSVSSTAPPRTSCA